ncbi:hypothetical protein MOQ72_34105 [Saccharopolyspora sp. K220]|uniref:hypothetical protein n=1 Tax=Saccharopolyspora soli TaxID=2926618 RepID=UPI001F55E95B|nr:hypothetical protein [Saccharopolyspora soli]MCI2422473.1 hypothetical protein [Saccharopolyspora soli]
MNITRADTVVAGDADPTVQLPRLGVPQCGALGPNAVRCTRQAGHTGRLHLAGDNGRVHATWGWRQLRLTPARVLTVAVLELDVALHASTPQRRGDRALVRTQRPGTAATFTVYHRDHQVPASQRAWRQATAPLIAEHVLYWAARGKPAPLNKPAPELDQWLNQHAAIQRVQAHPTALAGH